MKTLKSISLFCVFLMTMYSYAQLSDEKQIQKTIEAFSKAGDNHNVKALNKLLDNNYRVVMNRLFGSKEVAIIPKSVYLNKIGTKEWGGDTRELTIEHITINGSTASAKAILKGSKATFISLISLIKNEEGEWKMLSDIPTVL